MDMVMVMVGVIRVRVRVRVRVRDRVRASHPAWSFMDHTSQLDCQRSHGESIHGESIHARPAEVLVASTTL